MNTKKIFGLSTLVILIVYVGLGIYYLLGNKENVVAEQLINRLYTILQLLGIGFLIITSNIKEIHKRKLVRIADFIIVGGVGILILHLSTIGGYTIISIGLLLIFIDQIIRLKTLKKDLLIERLKLIWYLFFWTGAIFKELHFPGAKMLMFISVITLWIAITRHIFDYGIPKYLMNNK